MKLFIIASLLINIIVLVPVCYGMFSGASWADAAYGAQSGARGIVLAVYLAILLVSIGLLFNPLPAMVVALLLVQILYKVITGFTVGLSNPVVVSNLVIAAFHFVTVFLIWKNDGF